MVEASIRWAQLASESWTETERIQGHWNQRASRLCGLSDSRALALSGDGEAIWKGVAMSSSPWELAREGDEDVAAPFEQRALSICAFTARRGQILVDRGRFRWQGSKKPGSVPWFGTGIRAS